MENEMNREIVSPRNYAFEKSMSKNIYYSFIRNRKIIALRQSSIQKYLKLQLLKMN